VTDLLRWGSAGFPDKRIPWPGAGRALQRHGSSILLGTAAAVGLGASVFLGVGYVRYERLAISQEAAVRRAESANADLQDALARMRDQLGSANQSLGLAQSRMAEIRDEAKRQLAATEQVATSKTDRIGQLSSALDQAQRALHLAEAQRVTLIARLSKAENDIAEGQSRQQQVQAGVTEWQKKVQQLSAERERAIGERDQLRAQMKQLEQKLSLLQVRQPGRPATEQPAAAVQPMPASPAPAGEAQSVATAAPPSPAADAPASARVAGVLVPAQPASPATQAAVQPAMAAAAPPPARPAVAVGRSGLAQFERVLASTGVDVPHLFAQYGMRTGEGGPFIPAPRRAAVPDTSLTPEKLAALARIVKALPVTAPLQSYEIGSNFGVRGDPINGRASYHTGLDFRAPYMSPVYATAAGVVTFAGYRADYGKIVEIDHGHGITTRYGHLHRYTVSVGQRVLGHSQIGFLGSTGRATGPHVHYEVLVNGEPQDPTKFLGLARLVPVAQL
jgi:murein DD-endopeptidase MepM/ murein hydrolase activator NlpD